MKIIKRSGTEVGFDISKIIAAVSKANKEGIQKLGAKGIVEIDNQLKIILGSESKQLKKYIDEIKWQKKSFFYFIRHNSTKYCFFLW